MKVHNCKVFYSDSSLQIFVSFYLTTKTIYVINKKLTKYSKKLSTLRKRVLFKKKNKKNLQVKSHSKKKKRKNHNLNHLVQKEN